MNIPPAKTAKDLIGKTNEILAQLYLEKRIIESLINLFKGNDYVYFQFYTDFERSQYENLKKLFEEKGYTVTIPSSEREGIIIKY